MAICVNNELGDFGLFDAQIGLALEDFPHPHAVHFLIALCAWRPDGGPAASIQQAELDTNGVGNLAHDAAEGVDLADEMAFGYAADSGITGHLGDQVKVHGDHGGFEAHARAGAGSFATGMTRADHDDVVLFLHSLRL